MWHISTSSREFGPKQARGSKWDIRVGRLDLGSTLEVHGHSTPL